MARKGNPESTTSNDTTTSKEKTQMSSTVSAFETINADKIAELRGKVWERGVYQAELDKFIESGEPGVQVNLEAGRFSGKKPETVKTGFYNVIQKMEEKVVTVAKDGDDVYLIRTDM